MSQKIKDLSHIVVSVVFPCQGSHFWTSFKCGRFMSEMLFMFFFMPSQGNKALLRRTSKGYNAHL